MNENNPFTTFIDLIKVDQEIRALQQQANQGQQAIAQLKGQERSILENLASAQQRVASARKEVDAHELEMKTLDHKEKEKKQRFESANGYKEYQSLEKEVKQLQHKQHALEEVVLKAWNVLEGATKAYDILKAEVHIQQEELHKKIAEHTERLTALTADIAAKEQGRGAYEQQVPEEWIEKYTIMRLRVDDPVVPVTDRSCSACFYKIPEQDMLMLARNKMLQCKSCYRLLYLTK